MMRFLRTIMLAAGVIAMAFTLPVGSGVGFGVDQSDAATRGKKVCKTVIRNHKKHTTCHTQVKKAPAKKAKAHAKPKRHAAPKRHSSKRHAVKEETSRETFEEEEEESEAEVDEAEEPEEDFQDEADDSGEEFDDGGGDDGGDDAE